MKIILRAWRRLTKRSSNASAWLSMCARLSHNPIVNRRYFEGKADGLEVDRIPRSGRNLGIPIVGAAEDGHFDAVLSNDHVFFEGFNSLIGRALFMAIQALGGFRGDFDQYSGVAKIKPVGISLVAADHEIGIIKYILLLEGEADLEVEEQCPSTSSSQCGTQGRVEVADNFVVLTAGARHSVNGAADVFMLTLAGFFTGEVIHYADKLSFNGGLHDGSL